MPPKFDPNEVKYVYMRAVGGEVGATSSLAPKVCLNLFVSWKGNEDPIFRVPRLFSKIILGLPIISREMNLYVKGKLG